MEFHEPVLVDEIVKGFGLSSGSFVVDGTVGTAGHSLIFAQQLLGKGMVLGIDRDPEMLAKAAERLGSVATPSLKVLTENRRYDELPEILEEKNLGQPNAILLDLGFNSIQLEIAERGFSFMKDGPLDGRFNPNEVGTQSMKDIVNTAPEKELSDILWSYADERLSRQIAKAIVRRREVEPFERTLDLARVVTRCYPPKKRHLGANPATRTFQALRISANREVEYVEKGVRACLDCLAPGGVMSVISFHSIEDRIVKKIFDEKGSPRPDPSNIYAATSTVGLDFSVESRGATKPKSEESDRNPRARSARLRTIRRLEATAG